MARGSTHGGWWWFLVLSSSKDNLLFLLLFFDGQAKSNYLLIEIGVLGILRRLPTRTTKISSAFMAPKKSTASVANPSSSSSKKSTTSAVKKQSPKRSKGNPSSTSLSRSPKFGDGKDSIWSCRRDLVGGVSNQNAFPHCTYFVFADALTIILRMKNLIAKDVYMSTQCPVDWYQEKRSRSTMRRFCEIPLGFEAAYDRPYVAISKKGGYLQSPGVSRYVVEGFLVFDLEDIEKEIVENFMLGPGFPCIASVNGTLLMDEPPAGPLHSSHAVLVYGVDLSNPKDHRCLIKNS